VLTQVSEHHTSLLRDFGKVDRSGRGKCTVGYQHHMQSALCPPEDGMNPKSYRLADCRFMMIINWTASPPPTSSK
jgi:hypothetical protein